MRLTVKKKQVLKEFLNYKRIIKDAYKLARRYPVNSDSWKIWIKEVERIELKIIRLQKYLK